MKLLTLILGLILLLPGACGVFFLAGLASTIDHPDTSVIAAFVIPLSIFGLGFGALGIKTLYKLFKGQKA